MAVLRDSESNIVEDKAIDIQLCDISLERLYGVLFVYFELYPNYKFTIKRFPKYYRLDFQGWGGS